jgi:hypothetical protein
LSRRARVVLRAALAAAAVAAIVASSTGSRRDVWSRRSGDLPVYVDAAERMARGEEIYRPDEVQPFTYPPFLALAAYPLTPLARWAQRAAWLALNAALTITLLLLVRRNLAPLLEEHRPAGG